MRVVPMREAVGNFVREEVEWGTGCGDGGNAGDAGGPEGAASMGLVGEVLVVKNMSVPMMVVQSQE